MNYSQKRKKKEKKKKNVCTLYFRNSDDLY